MSDSRLVKIRSGEADTSPEYKSCLRARLYAFNFEAIVLYPDARDLPLKTKPVKMKLSGEERFRQLTERRRGKRQVASLRETLRQKDSRARTL